MIRFRREQQRERPAFYVYDFHFLMPVPRKLPPCLFTIPVPVSRTGKFNAPVGFQLFPAGINIYRTCIQSHFYTPYHIPLNRDDTFHHIPANHNVFADRYSLMAVKKHSNTVMVAFVIVYVQNRLVSILIWRYSYHKS